MSEAPHPRWAIHAVPPADHPLWQAGCRWLGRDPETGETFGPPAGLDEDRWRAVTTTPAHYGFHATLKPPFTLRTGTSPETLTERLAAFAADRPPVALPVLAANWLGVFLALRPIEPVPAIDTLAGDCVAAFDDLRAPLSAAEIQRREAAGLTPRERALLETWGYPYVFEAFRFHYTLTDASPAAQAPSIRDAIDMTFGKALAATPPPCELALFHHGGDGPFRLMRRFRLSATAHGAIMHRRCATNGTGQSRG